MEGGAAVLHYPLLPGISLSLGGVFRGVSWGSGNPRLAIGTTIDHHSASMKQQIIFCAWQQKCMHDEWVQGKVLGIGSSLLKGECA